MRTELDDAVAAGEDAVVRRATIPKAPRRRTETGRSERAEAEPSFSAAEQAMRAAGQHPLFDAAWYELRHGAAPEPGLARYLSTGAALGHEPHWLMDTPWYFAQQPDADRSVPSLVHYAVSGGPRGVSPHPLFDVGYFLAQQPGRRAGAPTALADYLLHGVRDRLNPHPLFDTPFYLSHSPDVLAAGMDPVDHYLSSGAAQGRNPHPLFDSAWYLRTYADELLGGEGGGENPLIHYLTVGASMGLDPHPLFDSAWYVSHCGDPAARENPLLHYLRHGAADPNPLFARAWYAARMPDTFLDPLVHFVLHGGWSRNPHPLFDTGFYLSTNPDVADAGTLPLAHYLSSGAAELRDPHGVFVSPFYVQGAANAGLSGAERNPLVHYLTEGAARGVAANPWFDAAWYLRQNGDVASAGLDPLAHYAENGARELRDPHPLFSLDFYNVHAPDVAEAGRDPLVHYVQSGRAEGRAIRPADRWVDECAVAAVPWEVRRAPPPLAGREVCFFMTYSADGRAFPHVVSHMRAYKDAGFTLVMLMATEGLAGPVSPDAEALCDGILVRANHGLDFAAWACGFHAFADAWRADLLLLVNDSLYGPVSAASMDGVLRRVRGSEAEIVWLTDSRQVCHHTQSFFTALTKRGLRSEGVRSFWQGVRSQRSKEDVIHRYELTALSHMERAGVEVEVLFPTAPSDAEHNPTLALWQDLLDRGFPFLKVQLLRDRLEGVDPAGWQGRLAANPELRRQIELHLWEPRRAAPACPVPTPRRRFRRPAALRTYYGATTGVRPTDETDLALLVPFRYRMEDAAPSWTEPVAVVAHIFYPELCGHLLGFLRNIPVRADLFVSTDTAEKRDAIARVLAGWDGTVTVQVMPNIGRDIAPCFVGFRDVFDRYEVFLHVHSKKSPHEGRFAPWRDYLLRNLLGSPAIVASILDLFAGTDAGIVFSQHFEEVRTLLNWGLDFTMAQDLLRRAGIALSQDLVLEFPSSSFFWGRSRAVRPLLDLHLGLDDFPAEAGQVDGTLAHAIERSLLYFAEGSGLRWAKVAAAGSGVPPSLLVPVEAASELPAALSRVHHPLLGNPVSPLQDHGTITEVSPILLRPDRNPRPRLNLLLPTLQPHKVFGGLATALRIFGDLRAELGDGFDYRIVSTSEPVDLLAARSLPAYRLWSTDTPVDDQPSTIVDVTDGDGAELTVRSRDVFVASAWWTAVNAFRFAEAQAARFGAARPVVYLIQDHEPDFYGWSSRFGAARRTYRTGLPTLPLLNSEELANFMAETYGMADGFVVPFVINPAIGRSLLPLPKERTILVYGRPGTPRNCFEVLWEALRLWQHRHPVEAAQWRIVSAGEEIDTTCLPRVANLEVTGKLPLADYGALLSRAAVGISLMMSPHPSYPPLEMASAGVQTVTNSYGTKDLSRRSANIISVEDVTAPDVAAALERAVAAALPGIGKVADPAPVGDLPCTLPVYDPGTVAARIAAAVSG